MGEVPTHQEQPQLCEEYILGVLKDDGIFSPEPDCDTDIDFILTIDHNEEGSQRFIRGLKKTSDSYYRNQAFYVSNDFLTTIQHPFIMPFRGFSSAVKMDVHLDKDDAMMLKLIV